ncbi:MAG: phosphonate C-P lyase system protein PhnH [Paracoccaceae bacterium]
MDSAALQGGFTDTPVDAARAFRAAMRVMACPGQIRTLTGAAPPAPLSVAAGTLVLTLCDPQTPIHLAGAHDTQPVRDWITFHSGAPFAPRTEAQFAIGTWQALAPLHDYPVGTPDYPDRSATLVIEQDALEPEGALLSGPGIGDTAALNLPRTEAFEANSRLFPLGLDFFLTCGDRVAALPRTTKVSPCMSR